MIICQNYFPSSVKFTNYDFRKNKHMFDFLRHKGYVR